MMDSLTMVSALLVLGTTQQTQESRAVRPNVGTLWSLRTNGRIAFGGQRGLSLVNPDGTGFVAVHSGALPSWSPDGRKLAFTDTQANDDIFVIDAGGTGLRRLTDSPARDWCPAWSPDGERIAFTSNRSGIGASDVWVMNRDGSAQENLTRNPSSVEASCPSWRPDGRKMLFTRGETGIAASNGAYTMNPDGTGQTLLVADAVLPRWSPDGTSVAFCAFRNNRWDIYVVNADGSNERKLTEGPWHHDAPAWSPDGTRIVYRSSERGDNSDPRVLRVMNADGTDKALIPNTDGATNADWGEAPGELQPVVGGGGYVGVMCSNFVSPDVLGWPTGEPLAVARPAWVINGNGRTNNNGETVIKVNEYLARRSCPGLPEFGAAGPAIIGSQVAFVATPVSQVPVLLTYQFEYSPRHYAPGFIDLVTGAYIPNLRREYEVTVTVRSWHLDGTPAAGVSFSWGATVAGAMREEKPM